MKFPGYWVIKDNGNIIIESYVFDDTELDPSTNWKESWQNSDPECPSHGFIQAEKALARVAELLGVDNGYSPPVKEPMKESLFK